MSNAAHRILWTVIALLLVACGATGLAASLDQVPGVDPDTPLLWSGLLRLWRTGTPWAFALSASLGLVIAGLGLWLLRRELRPPGRSVPAELLLTDPPTNLLPNAEPCQTFGLTQLRTDILTNALRRDLAAAPGVRGVRVVLTGTLAELEIWLHLRVAAAVPIAGIHQYVAAAIQRFSRTGGLYPHHLDVTVTVDHTPALSPHSDSVVGGG